MLIAESYPTVYGKPNYVMKMYKLQKYKIYHFCTIKNISYFVKTKTLKFGLHFLIEAYFGACQQFK